MSGELHRWHYGRSSDSPTIQELVEQATAAIAKATEPTP